MRYLLLLLVLTGCTTTQMVKTATVTSQTYVLIQELDTIEAKFNAMPLDVTERTLVDAGLDGARDLLDRYDNDLGQLLIDIPVARARIDEGVGAFLTTKAGYDAYLLRIKQPADPQLRYFEDIAIDYKDNLIDILDDLETQGVQQINSGLGIEQMSLAFKALVLLL